MQFGPDGQLWLGTGDGGGGNDEYGHSQDPASMLGKLIRLNVDAPAPVIAAVGLRNPWRFSFDRANGQIVIADVGQGAQEEINVGMAPQLRLAVLRGDGDRPAGRRALRERRRRGRCCEKSHAGDGFCSITGGYVVRDPGLPTLNGRYLYGDFCATGLRSVDLANPAPTPRSALSVPGLSSFGEDACGRIFVVSLERAGVPARWMARRRRATSGAPVAVPIAGRGGRARWPCG